MEQLMTVAIVEDLVSHWRLPTSRRQGRNWLLCRVLTGRKVVSAAQDERPGGIRTCAHGSGGHIRVQRSLALMHFRAGPWGAPGAQIANLRGF